MLVGLFASAECKHGLRCPARCCRCFSLLPPFARGFVHPLRLATLACTPSRPAPACPRACRRMAAPGRRRCACCQSGRRSSSCGPPTTRLRRWGRPPAGARQQDASVPLQAGAHVPKFCRLLADCCIQAGVVAPLSHPLHTLLLARLMPSCRAVAILAAFTERQVKDSLVQGHKPRHAGVQEGLAGLAVCSVETVQSCDGGCTGLLPCQALQTVLLPHRSQHQPARMPPGQPRPTPAPHSTPTRSAALLAGGHGRCGDA